MIGQNVDYMHHNPVAAMLVVEPQRYLFSSAKDYYGEKGMIEVELLH
jgi:hypothetical protein